MLFVNALVQVVLVFVFALVWWLIASRHRTPFLPWLGMKPPRVARVRWFVVVAVGTLIATSGIGLASLVQRKDAPTAVAPFRGLGWAALPGVAVYAILQTSLAEEVLFRGLLGKSLIRLWGFAFGNGVQAFAFGALHGLLLGPTVGWGVAVGLTVFAGAIGWLLGFLNERLADGSVLPSWALHATANVIAGCWAAFFW